MAEIRNGDKIMLSGHCGEDGIIADDWAKNFAKTEIQRGESSYCLEKAKPETCFACGHALIYPSVEGEICVKMYNFKKEELEELGKEYDLIYEVQPNKRGFGPVLVGGKRYISFYNCKA